MLAPSSAPTVPTDGLNKREKERLMETEQSLTEDYGEASGGARTMGGGVDFFSSLGTERQKKQKVDKPNPDNVSNFQLLTGHRLHGCRVQ